MARVPGAKLDAHGRLRVVGASLGARDGAHDVAVDGEHNGLGGPVDRVRVEAGGGAANGVLRVPAVRRRRRRGARREVVGLDNVLAANPLLQDVDVLVTRTKAQACGARSCGVWRLVTQEI